MIFYCGLREKLLYNHFRRLNCKCESTVKLGQTTLFFEKTIQLIRWERRQPCLHERVSAKSA